jgi:YesN/AraC family two-component response regulator
LEAIELQAHDFYLLDINTPLVGGLDCLKMISSKYPSIPKIIISAYHDLGYISEAFSTGCSDYLKKLFNLQELEIRINHLTAQVHHTSESQYDPMIHLSNHYSFNKESNFLYY